MAAGLGFKDFTTGEVLTAADVDGYLMQGVWVFASAAARDAAVTSPQEGNFAYLKDTNVTTYYTGSAWANLDTTGMTNPMTTTGDVIYSSSGSTPARLGIGTAGQVLKVNSGATAPEWGAAASGALTLISTTNFSAVTTQSLNNVFSSTYTNYAIIISITSTASSGGLRIRLRASGTDATGSNYLNRNIQMNGNSTVSGEYSTQTTGFLGASTSTGSGIAAHIFAPNLAQPTFITAQSAADTSNDQGAITHNLSTAYDGLTIYTSNSVNMDGSISVYGFSK